ncbi:hypothetical protein DdX_10001 [Ditylenchus destructor]|uniref:Transmembrane protein n=1 Tax=Ditylenchus destructor TaxID=166010 RepID=A0AAD4MZN6_9BILA|nr:hypothetical protein DdX_10001 [Ditylenchus destructor]
MMTGNKAVGRSTFNPFLRTTRSALSQGGGATMKLANQGGARGFGTIGRSDLNSILTQLRGHLNPWDPLAKALKSPFGLIIKRNAERAADFAKLFMEPVRARQMIQEARRRQQILFIATFAAGGVTVYGAYKLLQKAYHFVTDSHVGASCFKKRGGQFRPKIKLSFV